MSVLPPPLVRLHRMNQKPSSSIIRFAPFAALAIVSGLLGPRVGRVDAGHPYYLTKYPLIAWQASPYDWVTDKDIRLGDKVNILVVQLAQNEWEHTAFALTNNTDKDQSYTIDVACDGVPREAVQVRRVRMYDGPRSVLSEAWQKPEILEDVDGPLDLPAKSTAHVWITVNSRNISPGRHRGWVRVLRADKGTEALALAMRVEVWPFRLPAKTGLQFYLFSSIQGPPHLADKLARLLSEHYVTMADFEVPPVKDGSQDTAHFDWLERMKIAKRWGINPVIRCIGTKKEDASSFEICERTARDLGFQEWWIYPTDEAPWGALPEIIEICKAVRKAAPSAKLFHPHWMGLVNGDKWSMEGIKMFDGYSHQWCMFHNYLLDDVFYPTRWKEWPKEMYDVLREQQRKGDYITYYHNTWRGVNYRDAALSWTRPDGWYCWKYGYDGYSSFCGDSVPHVEASIPRGSAKLGEIPPEKQPLDYYYYVEKVGDGQYEPLSCKRLEGFRDGLRDYIYLRILDDLAVQAETSGKPKLEDLARSARETIDETFEDIMLYMVDHGIYCSAKKRLASAIIKLMKAGLEIRLNPDGTVVRHRWLTPEIPLAPEDGGDPEPDFPTLAR